MHKHLKVWVQRIWNQNVIIFEDFRNTNILEKKQQHFSLQHKIVTTGYLQYPNKNTEWLDMAQT
jgi:hypothetical protein